MNVKHKTEQDQTTIYCKKRQDIFSAPGHGFGYKSAANNQDKMIRDYDPLL